jgi:hypothetical protein
VQYNLTATKTIVNVPSISGDLAPNDLDGFMPSALFGSNYTVDVLFELEFNDIESGLSPESITQVVATTPGRTGVTFSVVNSDPFSYTLRTQGVFTEPLFESKYNILVQGDTPNSYITLTDIATLPENFLAIFRWTPPSVFWFLFSNSYNFVVNPGSASETSIALDQYIYWDWNTGLATFATDLAKGVL